MPLLRHLLSKNVHFLHLVAEPLLRPVLCGCLLYLDHGGCLHIGEFLHAALASDDIADLKRQVRVLLFLTHLQARQVRVPATQNHSVTLTYHNAT